jgi:hypothetical protein
MYLRLAPAIAVERIYRRLYRMGRPLAGERTRAETAYEFMGKLIDKINTIREQSRYTNYLARTRQDVEYLTDLYQDTLFAHHTINKGDVSTALNLWKHLRTRLMMARLHVIARRVLAPTKQSPTSIHKKIASSFRSSQ